MLSPNAEFTTTHAHRAQHGPTSSAQNPEQGDGAGGTRRHRVAETARERGDAGAAAARGGGAGRVGGGAADVDARGRGVRRGPGAAPGGRAGRGRRAGGALPGMPFFLGEALRLGAAGVGVGSFHDPKIRACHHVRLASKSVRG